MRFRTVFLSLSLLLLSIPVRAQESSPPLTLNAIFAPIVVGTPPTNAFNGLARMPDGEIRHYVGSDYIASKDEGLTWSELQNPESAPPTKGQGLGISPSTGTCLRMIGHAEEGTFVLRSTQGVVGHYERIPVDPRRFIMIRPPYFSPSRDLILFAGHTGGDPKQIGVFRSENDGRTWQRTLLEPGPYFEVVPPHAKPRWENNCCEPTILELKDGRLWMLARTSQDMMYECYSNDAGASWSSWTPSSFYGTLTMPTLHRLSDCRILCIWCNTTPLVEADRSDSSLSQYAQDGTWEDVFTNRDAVHAAISEDDGATWLGFRELRLNPLRNDSDYAERAERDLSVHQSQVLELTEEGKILISHGQDEEVRALLIFDVDWLYESSRSCRFENGLDDWSTFKFHDEIRGHCAHNRNPGPVLIPHPDIEERRVLHLQHTIDDRFAHDVDGAVWNFPAAKSGSVKTRFRLQTGGKGISIRLLDRWVNPSDPHVGTYANYELTIPGDGRLSPDVVLTLGKWHDIELYWSDVSSGACHILVDGQETNVSLPLNQPSRHGISYVHFQASEDEDPHGTLIESVNARK
jgi:hypothetical protein